MSSSEWGTIFQIVAEILGPVSAVFVGLLAWIGSYQIQRLDEVSRDVNGISKTYVTREELTAAVARIEGSVMHRLGQIESKIEDNAKEAKQDRHDLRNQMTPVALDVARMAGETSAATKIAEALTNVIRSMGSRSRQ